MTCDILPSGKGEEERNGPFRSAMRKGSRLGRPASGTGVPDSIFPAKDCVPPGADWHLETVLSQHDRTDGASARLCRMRTENTSGDVFESLRV